MTRVVSGLVTLTLPPLEQDDFTTLNRDFHGTLSNAVVHDAPQTRLPGTSATDDLALGGTNHLVLTTGDVMGTSVTRYARLEIPVPHDYPSGESMSVIVQGKITDAAAVVSATVDVNAYVQDGTGTASGDLCTTGAQSCNTTVDTTYVFTLTPTLIVRGQTLNVRVQVAVDDTGGGDACTFQIGAIGLRCNARG